MCETVMMEMFLLRFFFPPLLPNGKCCSAFCERRVGLVITKHLCGVKRSVIAPQAVILGGNPPR